MVFFITVLKAELTQKNQIDIDASFKFIGGKLHHIKNELFLDVVDRRSSLYSACAIDNARSRAGCRN